MQHAMYRRRYIDYPHINSLESSTSQSNTEYDVPNEKHQVTDTMAQQRTSFMYIEYLCEARVASRTVPDGFRSGLPAPCESDELDNSVHPIFARRQFVNLTDKQYHLLFPALQLATKFITEECLQSWWIKVLFGEVKENESEEWTDKYFSSPPQESFFTNALGIQEFLMDIVNVLKFIFDPMEAEGVNDADAESFANQRECESALTGSRNEEDESYVDEPRIVLHSRYIINLEYLLNVNAPQAQFEVAYFMFTKTIVHELAHIVYMISLGGKVQEPFYSQADMKAYKSSCQCPDGGELGWSWEMYMFGAGFMWSIEHPRSLSMHHQRQYTDSYGHIREDPNQLIVIPNWWLSLWFRKSVWQNMALLRARNKLRVPSEAESGFIFCWIDRKWDLTLDGRTVTRNCNIRDFFLQDLVGQSIRDDSPVTLEPARAQQEGNAYGIAVKTSTDTEMDDNYEGMELMIVN